MNAKQQAEVAVVGGGPAGMVAAALLARAGVSTALVALPAPPDTRTTALMQPSLSALEEIGVWPRLAAKSGPLRKLRLIDVSGSVFRAPQVLFDCAELGLAVFGHNIANTHLLEALREVVETASGLSVISARVTGVTVREGDAEISLDSGETVSARLVVGADGRDSVCRKAAGIHARTSDYPQAALTLNFAHLRPHDGVSTEFHRRQGPLTLVPLPGQRSSLVLVGSPHEVQALAELDDSALGRELEALTEGLLGSIHPEAGRGVRPLSRLSVDRFAQNRVALVGEAAHVLPPIGAQGLNLGIRDAAGIARLASQALSKGGDPGAAQVLNEYHRSRRADAEPRALAVDLLNRSLLSDFLPLSAGRAVGLWTLSAVAPLRRAVMRRGLALDQ